MTWLKRKLAVLQRDHTVEAGHPFVHFACPITLDDKPGHLCRGHIINQAFSGSSRRSTVQRADVDNWYGSVFESDFVKLRHSGRHRIQRYLLDPQLGRELPPSLRLGDKSIDYFITEEQVPAHFTPIGLMDPESKRKLVLKVHPQELASLGTFRLDFGIEADLRLPAFVSLLKAAHLTLFDMLGYRYAYSLAGRFLGQDLLGKFYKANKGRSKKAVLRDAWDFFKPYSSMFRPLLVQPAPFRGTASDRKMLVCRSSGTVMWGLMVLVRTGRSTHAVMTPIMDNAPAAGRFYEFLKSNGQHFEASVSLFKDGAFQISKDWQMMNWPSVELP